MAAAVICALLASACLSPRDGRMHLQVSVAEGANKDRPVPVDVVFVWNKQLASTLAALSARQWFEQKQQFRRDDPDERAITVHGWEWVPGQIVPEIELPIPPSAWRSMRAVYVFVDYRTEGVHRFRLPPGASAVVALLEDDVRVQPVEAIRTRRLPRVKAAR
jgi:type VI secretion system protein